jgi:hypothetical protein
MHHYILRVLALGIWLAASQVYAHGPLCKKETELVLRELGSLHVISTSRDPVGFGRKPEKADTTLMTRIKRLADVWGDLKNATSLSRRELAEDALSKQVIAMAQELRKIEDDSIQLRVLFDVETKLFPERGPAHMGGDDSESVEERIAQAATTRRSLVSMVECFFPGIFDKKEIEK